MDALDLQTGALDTGSGWSADTAPADSPAQPSGPPSPASMPPSTSTSAQDDAEPQDDADEDDLHDLQRAKQIRAENRNLRSRAKDAEASRDGLLAELNIYRQQQVEAVAREHLRDAGDLLARHEITEFITADGLSVDAVKSAAAALAAERPHLAAEPVVTAPPSNRPLEGLRAGASPERAPQAVSWRDVLGGR